MVYSSVLLIIYEPQIKSCMFCPTFFVQRTQPLIVCRQFWTNSFEENSLAAGYLHLYDINFALKLQIAIILNTMKEHARGCRAVDTREFVK
jgi:hypothetical protein